ncbi:MAG: carboxypeptidase-like regulatory domain-containing protein [Bacteroidetes bacterium]|nr:carboxypeptidase-like regulatory domain-containing protein [Bacteroidota bacterium]
MKKRFRLLTLLGILCLNTCIAVAQKKTPALITADFRNASMEQFVSELEKQTGFRFYFDPTTADSIRINFSITSQPLEKILDQAFAGSDFFYLVDDDGEVYITKGKKIGITTTAKSSVPNNLIKQTTGDTIIAREKAKAPVLKNVQTAPPDKIIDIGTRNLSDQKSNKATVAGFVKDIKTGEPVSGASVSVETLKTGVVTDQYGYFSLTLPKGRHVLLIEGISIKETTRQIMLHGDGKINIELESLVMVLRNVTITAQKLSNIRNPQMGLQKIDISAIKQIPVVFGEPDILRAVIALPGVKTVGEASTGLNVRGGSPDQNLILFNDVTIYNPSHFFGMFSALNPEIVKDVELFKSSIPARYGGRLSSVLNITGREGNKKEFSGSAGIGVLTSRLNIEGPLIKDKSSFIIGGRTTYANWLLNLLPDQYKNSRASFYDINLGITHEINKKNNIYLTGYISSDRFNLNNDTIYRYSNKNISLKWKHIFNNKFTGIFIGGYDRYEYSISSDQSAYNAYKLSFDINQANFKALFTYYLNNKHTIEFGVTALYYKLHPGSYLPDSKESIVAPDRLSPEQSLESAAFISDRYTITRKLSAEAGLRYSMYNYVGPQQVNIYPAGIPKTEENSVGVKDYSSGKIIQTYSAPEIRASLRYAFNDSFSIKASYNSQTQYIHLISNTTAMAPTDIWKLSDPNIKPQMGDQVSLGLYKNFKSNTIETSLEVYYKRIKDYLDYKSGAELIMNHHLETDVVATKGKAYGIEFLLKKTSGKLNGWISYTWSRVFLKMDDSTQGSIVNKGQYYPANYDKPNDLTVIGNYKINHRFSVSLNVTYSTGRPITLPIGRFYFSNGARTLYADRNAYRIPDYFRADFSMNIEGNHKIYQKTHNSWSIGVYNLTGRKNAYSVYYVSENGSINGYKLSIFGSAIPYVNFNIRF